MRSAVNDRALLAVEGVGKTYGSHVALRGITAEVRAGEVLCILGDNGAGKSTLIKILSGQIQPSAGQLIVNGEVRAFSHPRQALAEGIATVYQDLALVPQMSVWRNFFLAGELTVGVGLFRRLDRKRMRRVAHEQLALLGIQLDDVEQSVGTLSGGQQQSIAIARAVYRGAKVLILDEPTSALGVKQSAEVLGIIAEAKRSGIGVVFITHNPRHAHPIGDRFLVLNHGRSLGQWDAAEITREQLAERMAGIPEGAGDPEDTATS